MSLSDQSVEEKKLCEKVESSCKLTRDRANTAKQQNINMISKKEANKHQNFQDFSHNKLNEANEEVINGRASRISNESAFSSASDSGEDYSNSDNNNINSISSSSSTSGRSSVVNGNSLECDVKLECSLVTLCSEFSEALNLIEAIRLKFLETFKKEGNSEELYDQSDLLELRKSINEYTEKEQSLAYRLISRYVSVEQALDIQQDTEQREKVIKEASEKVNELLKFRKRYSTPTTLAEDFCKEYFLIDGIFTFGLDKEKLPVLYIRARIHRKWSATFDESFRRFIAWQVDRCTKSYSGAQVAKTIDQNGLIKDGSFSMCFDCYNISYSCIDMDSLKFLVHLFVNYYPSYCRHVWLTDLPWLFRSIWKLVKTWLPEDSKVQLISSKQLVDYIDEDQIPRCMRRSDQNSSEKPPFKSDQILTKNLASIRGVEELGKELALNPNEVKQFKAHVEKMRKEYD